MRILDRYVILSFIKNYLISLMVLIGLYVILDMVFNFDELAEVKSNAAEGTASLFAVLAVVVDYYFHQSFLFYVQLSGVIPVVAAAFTLMRMSRFNELTALLSAGVPLLRVAMPIVLCGVVLNLILLPLNQEVVIPSMIPRLTTRHDDLHRTSARSFTIGMMQDDKGGLLNAGRYHPMEQGEPPWIDQLTVIELDDTGQVAALVKADKAQWDAPTHQWLLTNGTRIAGLRPDEVRQPEEKLETWPARGITPEEITLFRNSDYVELLPTERINKLLQRPKTYGTTALLRTKHFRWSQLILNIVLLLLAIPCVLTREPGNLKAAALKSLVLVGLCMGCTFVARQLADKAPAGEQWAHQWPAIMAWAPIFLFLPLSIFLLDRLHNRKT
jgi:lipopolysaccharide export LptBFGC system permease protein LptF